MQTFILEGTPMRNANWSSYDHLELAPSQQKEIGPDIALRQFGNRKSLWISGLMAKAAAQQEPAP